MTQIRPLQQVSYTATHADILNYAVSGISLNISQDDVTGDCMIVYRNNMAKRVLVAKFEQAMGFAHSVIKKYPMQQFICCVDY